MKAIAFLILSVAVAACAVNAPAPIEETATSNLCVLEDCTPTGCIEIPCPSVPTGGGGDGGGSGGHGTVTTCENLNCSTDGQCRNTCHNQQAQCAVVCSGDGRNCTGSCLDWGSPNPFDSCDPGNPHPSGDQSCTGGGGTTCNTLDCTSDAQCQRACGGASVVCVAYTLSPGGPEHGACTNG